MENNNKTTKPAKKINIFFKKVFRYLNPKNLISDIEKMGFKTPFKNIIKYYLIFAAVYIGTVFAFSIRYSFAIVMLLAGLMIMPFIILNSFAKGYEDKRFQEVSQYIEQMLYSFDDSRKILKSLQDIEPLFRDTRIGDAIKCAQNDIVNYNVEVALSNFEKKYDCQKIHQMHQFMLEIERVGGNPHKSIALLLQDRAAWVNRTMLFKREKNHKKNASFIAIVTSFILCVVMNNALPAEINIKGNIISQLSATGLFIADLFLFYIIDKKNSVSMLNNLKTRKDSEVKKYYAYVINYNAKREFKKNIKLIIVPIILLFVGILWENTLIDILSCLFMIFILMKHKIDYKTRYKAIRNEIYIQFPRWLMNMALLIQSNSIQVALYKSIPTAAVVLQPELIRLNNSLREDATQSAPYLDFMSLFNIPEITSTMRMFYAISLGTGSDIDKQIANIIERNNLLLDETEKLAFDNIMAGMYMLFLAPQLTGACKLMCDMVIFFIGILNGMNMQM